HGSAHTPLRNGAGGVIWCYWFVFSVNTDSAPVPRRTGERRQRAAPGEEACDDGIPYGTRAGSSHGRYGDRHGGRLLGRAGIAAGGGRGRPRATGRGAVPALRLLAVHRRVWQRGRAQAAPKGARAHVTAPLGCAGAVQVRPRRSNPGEIAD